jgi:hypothetical protein
MHLFHFLVDVFSFGFGGLCSVFYRDACPGISFYVSRVYQHCPFALLDRFGCVG